MQATAELQVIPLGAGVSVREEVKQVIEVLAGYPLKRETHASGTNLEGDLDTLLQAVAEVHRVLHQSGSVRLLSYLKLETRSDKPTTLAGKRL